MIPLDAAWDTIPAATDEPIPRIADAFPELFARLRALRLDRLDERAQINPALDQRPRDRVDTLSEPEKQLVRPIDPLEHGRIDLLGRSGPAGAVRKHPRQLGHQLIEAAARLVRKCHRSLLRFASPTGNRRGDRGAVTERTVAALFLAAVAALITVYVALATRALLATP